MFRQNLIAAAVAGVWLAALYPAAAAAQQPGAAPAVKSEPIYGYGMMNTQERDAYRAKMRNARSEQERQTIRDEHHAAMQARAKERGITLPERPQGAGPSVGPGYGPGERRGPPEGMGPGAGPRGPGYGPGERRGPPEGMGPGMGPRGPGYGPGERKGPPESRGS